MEISLIDHVVGAGRSVYFDSSSRSRLTSRVDHVMRKVSDLQRRSGEVLRAGRSATVLIQDQETTYALEPWASWQYEHGVLAAMSCLAEPPEGDTEEARGVLLGRVTEAVLQGSLAPFADLRRHHGERHELARFSSSQLQDRYREALDIAASGEPVVICRRDKPVSVLEPFTLRNRESEFVRHINDTMRFLASAQLAAESGMASSSWVAVSAYPWLAVLPPEAVGEFAAEMLPTLLEALRDNDPDTFALALSAWQASCEARGDEELAEALRTPASAVARTRVRVASISGPGTGAGRLVDDARAAVRA
jgi:antitoxin (DNA-binding transcriptional repressor) of toxin-antitoxin stability system